MIGKKVVGVLDFDSAGRDRGLRKVLQVARDDRVAAACDRRGENMTVVGVGKVEHWRSAFRVQ